MNTEEFISAWNFMFGVKEFNEIEKTIIEVVVTSSTPEQIAQAFIEAVIVGYELGSEDQPPMSLITASIIHSGGVLKDAKK